MNRKIYTFVMAAFLVFCGSMTVSAQPLDIVQKSFLPAHHGGHHGPHGGWGCGR